jgi:protein required for attachment to host cells
MAGTRLEHGTWILVADGEKALFLRNEGDALYPNFQVFREMKDENPATRDQSSDAPGTHFDTAAPNKSGYEETDWQRIGKERFAEEIAERLYKLAHRGKFEKLILVAPPTVLGTLRKSIHKEVAARVVDEIPKTLTNHTTWDIEKLLQNSTDE